jgi:hypothetical protein
MTQRRDAGDAEPSVEDDDIDRLPRRVAAEARLARAAVLRSFLRLREQGVRWGDDPEGSPDPAARNEP